MLVLSRQPDESIMVGDDIEITVMDIRGDKVRLGIAAPKGVPVHRKEVYVQLKRVGGVVSLAAGKSLSPPQVAGTGAGRAGPATDRGGEGGCGGDVGPEEDVIGAG